MYETTTYKHVNGVSVNANIIILPMKAEFRIDENCQARFLFRAYDAILDGHDPKQHRTLWSDKFPLNDIEPSYTEWEDLSGGQWRGLNWIGPYVSWAQKCHEFKISLTGKFCCVDAIWPHKRWQHRSMHKEMRYEGIIMDLDDKSFQVLDKLMKHYGGLSNGT